MYASERAWETHKYFLKGSCCGTYVTHEFFQEYFPEEAPPTNCRTSNFLCCVELPSRIKRWIHPKGSCFEQNLCMVLSFCHRNQNLQHSVTIRSWARNGRCVLLNDVREVFQTLVSKEWKGEHNSRIPSHQLLPSGLVSTSNPAMILLDLI